MVNIDLDIKGLVGLTESGSIDKEKLTEHLDKFDKKDIIEYIKDSIFEEIPDEENEDVDI